MEASFLALALCSKGNHSHLLYSFSQYWPNKKVVVVCSN